MSKDTKGEETEEKMPGGEDPGQPVEHVEEELEGGEPVDAGERQGDNGPSEARYEELTAQNEELLDNLVRLKAEFENYRKRMVREQTRILETAEAGLVKKLLPLIDNLERAVESTPEGEETRAIREGVTMVLEQMLDILGKEGLEVVDPEGEPFDPEHHEAMMVLETDECPEDTVLEVTQKGYRFNGILLRPAMVKVSCAVSS